MQGGRGPRPRGSQGGLVTDLLKQKDPGRRTSRSSGCARQRAGANKPTQLRRTSWYDAAGIISIGPDAHGGERRSHMARLSHSPKSPRGPVPHAATLGKGAGLQANMFDPAALVTNDMKRAIASG